MLSCHHTLTFVLLLKVCEPSTGKCVDAGLCNKCQFCTPGANNVGYTCKAIENKCGSCQWCDPLSGGCQNTTCPECNQCDPALNSCKPTPNTACGDDKECNKCDATGRCAPTPDADCTSNNATVCELEKCDQSGKCIVRVNEAAVNVAVCGAGGECFTEVCQADGSCDRVPKAENTACSDTKGMHFRISRALAAFSDYSRSRCS